jgi:hypothetical protein
LDIKIQSISAKGLSWLESNHAKRVLHVFNPVSNLIDDQNSVISLVRPEIGNGPFTAVTGKIDFREYIDIKSNILVKQKLLEVGKLKFDFSNALTWNSMPNWQSISNDPKQLYSGLDAVEYQVGTEGPPQSFAELVLNIPRNYPESDPTFARAKTGVMELFSGFKSGESMAMRNGAELLAGLGVGLTPAGDDFLVGSILALWSYFPESEAQRLSTLIAKEASPRTNSISAAWINASAQGEAGQHWHRLLEALQSGNSEMLQNAVRAILPTGHTSGADSLGGFVATLRLLSEQT